MKVSLYDQETKVIQPKSGSHFAMHPKWRAFIGRDSKTPRRIMLCSKHFKKSDINRVRIFNGPKTVQNKLELSLSGMPTLEFPSDFDLDKAYQKQKAFRQNELKTTSQKCSETAKKLALNQCYVVLRDFFKSTSVVAKNLNDFGDGQLHEEVEIKQEEYDKGEMLSFGCEPVGISISESQVQLEANTKCEIKEEPTGMDALAHESFQFCDFFSEDIKSEIKPEPNEPKTASPSLVHS